MKPFLVSVIALAAALWTCCAACAEPDPAQTFDAATQAYLQQVESLIEKVSVVDNPELASRLRNTKDRLLELDAGPRAEQPWTLQEVLWGEDTGHKRNDKVGQFVVLEPDGFSIPPDPAFIGNPAPRGAKRVHLLLTNGEYTFRLRIPQTKTKFGTFRLSVQGAKSSTAPVVQVDPETLAEGAELPAPAVPAAGGSLTIKPGTTPAATSVLKDPLYKNQQASVHGIVVTETNAGLAGQAIGIIATANSSDRTKARFHREVGKEMAISLDEAVRAVQVIHPAWNGTGVRFSFEDKYVAKDGGSAGTAFAVCLRSLLEGFAIDPLVAMTGDITVDQRVRKVGGVVSKIRGAIADGAGLVGIPRENEDAIRDLVVLHSLEPLLQTQVFALGSLDEAVGLARSDRGADLAAAIERFAVLQARFAEVGISCLKEGQALPLLTEVLDLAPNHLSAAWIRDKLREDKRWRLSLSESLTQILRECRPVFEAIEAITPGGPRPSKALRTTMVDAQSAVRKLRTLVHPDVEKFRYAAEHYIRAANQLVNARSAGGALIKKMNSAGGNLVESYRSLGRDADTIESLMRQQ